MNKKINVFRVYYITFIGFQNQKSCKFMPLFAKHYYQCWIDIFLKNCFYSNIDKNFQETSVWEYLLDKLKTPSAEGFLI